MSRPGWALANSDRMKPLQSLVRPNIWALEPYSSARDEYKGVAAEVFLDANENPYNAPVNRYPDPLQEQLKALLAKDKTVAANRIFLGNGSDEAIDLVYRVFCEPAVDNVVAIAPTYGMYQVCADINNVEYRKVLLDENFQFDVDSLLNACDEHTKVIWLCTPNNPTGNDLQHDRIKRLLREFEGIVVIDEAYSDFSKQTPFRLHLDEYPNAVVLNTFSKAYGCAAIRLGMAFASAEIISLFNKVKYPYNVNLLTQEKAMAMLAEPTRIRRRVMMILEERDLLMYAFSTLPVCERVYPSDANFFLAKVKDADSVYRYLVEQKIIVRNRSRVALCDNCLRITIGTKNENDRLIGALRCYR